MGVPGEVPSGRRARVEVAGAFVVGEEVDAAPDPHGIRHVPFEFDQRCELAVSVTIDPQRAGTPAPVALPAGGVEGVPTDDHARTAGLMRDRPRRAEVEGPGGAAVEGDGMQGKPSGERLLPVGGDDHPVAFAAPSDDVGHGTEVRETPRWSASGRHHVCFEMALLATREGHQIAVGRQTRIGDESGCRGQPVSGPAVGAHRPEIVFGYEDDPISVNGRVQVVAEFAHGSLCSCSPHHRSDALVPGPQSGHPPNRFGARMAPYRA